MEAVHDPGQSSVSWVAKLVEVLQPLSLRADRLGAMELFAGLRWSELEFAADLLHEIGVERGTRLTVQGPPKHIPMADHAGRGSRVRQRPPAAGGRQWRRDRPGVPA